MSPLVSNATTITYKSHNLLFLGLYLISQSTNLHVHVSARLSQLFIFVICLLIFFFFQNCLVFSCNFKLTNEF